MNNTSRDSDILLYLFAGILIVPAFLAGLVPQVRQWFVDHGVLVTKDVLVPLGDGAGFDLARTVILAGVVLVALAIGIATVRAQARAKAKAKLQQKAEA